MLNLEGRELGGCKLIRKIGEGGMGEVYLAEQIRVGNRQVAVKVVRPADLTTSGGVSGDVERRFKREAALLGQFSHPNILPVYDSGVEDGYLYIVMPYAQEGSLSDAIRGRFGRRLELPLELPAAVDLIGQVASALQYTHDHDVVHRDVKPGNILIRIEPDGHWRMLLADFGVARGAETTTQQTLVTGTFAYMAPEQFSGKFSPASDQYALGVVAYQLLAGHPPFEGEIGELTRAHLYEAPPSLRAQNPAVTPAVEAVVGRALAKDPAQRYPSVRQFADAFRAAASGKATDDLQPPPIPEALAPVSPTVPAAPPSTARPNGAPPQGDRPNSAARLLVIGVIAALLFTFVAAILAASLRGPQPTPTPTTTTGSATPGQTTPISGGQATVSAQATQTAQAAGNVPTATATASLGADMGSAPPAPAGVGALTFSEASPACDSVYANRWQRDDQTQVDCSAAGTKVTATASNTLACVEYTQPTPDAYVSALATQGSGDVTLGFRVNHAGSGNTQQVTGYFFRVTPATSAYLLFSIDAAGKATTIGSGTIPATLAQHFAIGARYSGNTLALYINGIQIGAPISDATYTTGGMALCATGVTTYRAWQVYAAS
jgi:serine/threonine protein kinase